MLKTVFLILAALTDAPLFLIACLAWVFTDVIATIAGWKRP